jgi:hypothetical protein
MNNPFDYPIFCDCGAPSYYNKMSRGKAANARGLMGAVMRERKHDNFTYTEEDKYEEYRESYIKFLLENKDRLTRFTNLDVINNAELTYKNQKIMESAGLHPIPVFHLGEDLKWLKKYVRDYEYVALGGLIPNTTIQLYNWLDPIFRDIICDEKGYPRIKVHGFACTSLGLMTRYPWYSVDSATARKLGNFGSILLPQKGAPEKLATVQISTRDAEAKWKVFGGERQKSLNERAERYGMTLHEIQDSIIARVTLNYLTFLEKIEELVPPWPWRIKDFSAPMDTIRNRESAAGANERLTLFFAGVLAKKEEYALWAGIDANRGQITKSKGRLQSFFYRKDLEWLMQLRENGRV